MRVRQIACGMLSAVSLLAAMPVFNNSAVAAPLSGEPGINCYLEPLRLSAADIEAFLSRADADLGAFSSGGLPLSTRVRMLAASDVRTLEPILARVNKILPMQAAGTPAQPGASDAATAAPDVGTLTSGATALQIAAIAEGLAAATVACSTAGNELGTIIQENVAKTGNEPFIAAFVRSLDNLKEAQIETAALGAARSGISRAADIGNAAGDVGGGSGDGLDEFVKTADGTLVTGQRGTLYFSDDGSGGSDEDEISPTRP